MRQKETSIVCASERRIENRGPEQVGKLMKDAVEVKYVKEEANLSGLGSLGKDTWKYLTYSMLSEISKHAEETEAKSVKERERNSLMLQHEDVILPGFGGNTPALVSNSTAPPRAASTPSDNSQTEQGITFRAQSLAFEERRIRNDERRIDNEGKALENESKNLEVLNKFAATFGQMAEKK